MFSVVGERVPVAAETKACFDVCFHFYDAYGICSNLLKHFKIAYTHVVCHAARVVLAVRYVYSDRQHSAALAARRV